MQPRIAFCSRCRGIRQDWNRRYILHWLLCKQWLRCSYGLRGFAILTAALVLGLPTSRASVFSGNALPGPMPVLNLPAPMLGPEIPETLRQLRTIESFLEKHKVGEPNRTRLAESIVESAAKYELNPRLLASVMIVESRGNPFAISGKAAVGVMQIHIPTWGQTADSENINLFKIEDNVDFGARILKDYVRRYGVWEGIKRYNGFIPGDPSWEESAQTYLVKVQRVYEPGRAAVERSVHSE